MKRFLLRLFAVALALNWIWEMIQMPAYEGFRGRSRAGPAAMCTAATFVDAVTTVVIYMLISLVAARHLRHSRKYYAVTAILGAACAVAFEKIASAGALWSYTGQMPIVPVLGVGLWPLAQLTLLVPLSVLLAVYWGSHD